MAVQALIKFLLVCAAFVSQAARHTYVNKWQAILRELFACRSSDASAEQPLSISQNCHAQVRLEPFALLLLSFSPATTRQACLQYDRGRHARCITSLPKLPCWRSCTQLGSAKRAKPIWLAATAIGKDCMQGMLSNFANVNLERLVTSFQAADHDRDGELYKDEFVRAVQSSGVPGMSPTMIDSLFNASTGRSNSTMNIEKFLAERVVRDLLGEFPNQPTTVIAPFNPKSSYLWTHWRGTIWSQTWPVTLVSTLMSLGIIRSVREFGHPSWPLFMTPDPAHGLIARLLPLSTLWDKLLTLTTFVLTFFVGQSFAFWRSRYVEVRSVANRLKDMLSLLAAYAARTPDGAYTPEARKMLSAAARNARLYHILYWANLVKRYRVASSDSGLTLLCELGHCSPHELECLLKMPRGNRCDAVRMWFVARGCLAKDANTILNFERGFIDVWLERSTAQRQAGLGTALDAKCPMLYLNLVQVLVDVSIILMPFAVYPRLGAMSVFLTGPFATAYRGLLDMSKRFLDPLGNYCHQSQFELPVLVRNFNAESTRFADVADEIPAP